MSWAAERRFIVVSILIVFALTVVGVTLIATLHHTPSCMDTTQNQGEQGVDCGGPCAFLCTALEQAPVTLFTRALSQASGRTDVIALVANQNLTAAAQNVPYTITLYGTDRSVVQKIKGVLDLPAASAAEGGRVLVFVPGASQSPAATASLEINAEKIQWFSMTSDERIIPKVGSYTITNEATAPRITTTLSNASTRALGNVKVYIAVFDAAGNAIGGSQTIIPVIPAQGSAPAVFTWNAPFPAAAATVQIEPSTPLPVRAGLP